MADPEAASFSSKVPSASSSSDRTQGDASRAIAGLEPTGFFVPPADPTAIGLGGAVDRTADGSSPADSAAERGSALKANSSVGPYRLMRKLGEGGMGAVWEAKHVHLDKPVALKFLPGRLLDRPEAVARFYREMKAAGRVTHPNVVQAYDAGEAGGVHYLAMELVSGSDLHRHVAKRGPFSVREAAKAVRQAALGLAAAHAQGLVHRDVKPMNLLVSKDGKVKLLDLGLARLAEDAAEEASKSRLTAAGMIMGTPDYMAPEQWDDTHAAGPAADLYALGCTLYFLLHGKAPFATECHATAVRKMAAHASEAPPDLAAARTDIPAGLSDLFRQLLAKKPEDRPASALEVAERLTPFASRTVGETSTVAGSAISVPPQAAAMDDTRTLDLGRAEGLTSTTSLAQTTPASLSPPATGNVLRALPSRRRVRFWSIAGAGTLIPLLLLGTIFFLQTPKGTIRVEVTDPEVEVRVKGETVLVKGPAEQELKFRAGAHTLVVQRGDFSFETHKFVLRKGETVAIKVELIGGAVRAVADGQEIGSRELATKDASAVAESAGTRVGWHGWPADAPAPAIAPFDAEQAKKHQEAWASYVGVPVVSQSKIGIPMRLIPPGEFLMGAEPETLPEEFHLRPQREVVLSHAFLMSACEITQSQFIAVLGRNPSYFRLSAAEAPRQPVETVSWYDAIEFCIELSKAEGFSSVYSLSDVERDANGGIVRATVEENDDSGGYRLPTEAQWEFTYRAGTQSRYSFGDSDVTHATALQHARISDSGDGHLGTIVVGSLLPNSFGIHDMEGNVCEWTRDAYDPLWLTNLDSIDPAGELQSTYHTTRGGGFGWWLEHLGAAQRRTGDGTNHTIGIRVIRTLPKEKSTESGRD